jgi:hypothetical protein
MGAVTQGNVVKITAAFYRKCMLVLRGTKPLTNTNICKTPYVGDLSHLPIFIEIICVGHSVDTGGFSTFAD